MNTFQRLTLVSLVAGLLALAPLSSARAAPDWYNTSVNSVGTNGTLLLELTDVAGSPAWLGAKWFLVTKESLHNAYLAIGLTAITSNLVLQVFVDPEDGTFPTIFNMFVKQ